MGRGVTGLRFPANASVDSRNDCAKSADRPAMQRIVGGKRNCEEMIAGSCGTHDPFATTIRCCQDNAARSGYNDA